MTQRKRISGLKRIGAIAVTAAMALSMAQPVQANNVLDEIGHFLECFGWMLTDPARQVQECGAKSPAPSLSSLSTPMLGGGPGPVAAVVLPEEEEPTCTSGSCSGED